MKIQRWPLVLILIALLTIVLGLSLGFLLEPQWFSRFGALVVLLGLAAEYQLLQLELSALYTHLNAQIESEVGPSAWQRRKQWLAHVTVVIGTLVWGFGDLLIA